MSELDGAAADVPFEPGPAKVDPETLVLRGAPRRPIRFRRGVIVGGAALASTALVGVAWVALKPPTFGVVAGDGASSNAETVRPPDVLAGAPKSYGDVPKLGPPLPGDLGRPILDRQRALGRIPAAGPDAELARQAEQAATTERERLAAERKAARESGVMVSLRSDRPAGVERTPASTGSADTAAADRSGTAIGAAAMDGDSAPKSRPLPFTREPDAAGDLNPHALQAAASPWMLSAGTVIAASLLTGLNSDLPGLVTAQVTENVRDSATGRAVLIPQGSRLIGRYDNVVAFGQRRALVVWQRIVLPDGSSVRVDNLPASDAAGHAGLVDRVDVHGWQLIKGVALSTLLGVGTELSIGGEGELVRAVREATQQNASRAGDQVVAKSLSVQPTVTVRPGWPLRVVVHSDIVLAPWKD